MSDVAGSGLRVLVLGGVETRFHAFEEVTPVLEELVLDAGHQPTVMRAPDALQESVLARFDAVASITTGGSLTRDQELSLLGAVHQGQNDRGRPVHFLGVHGAACSFQESAAYVEMLGGRFVRHPPMDRFDVEVEAPLHPVTRGVSRFSIHDEFYILELSGAVDVLISGQSPERAGARLPLGWCKRYGAGRVVYLAPGHGPEQLRNPGLRALVAGALGWFRNDAQSPG